MAGGQRSIRNCSSVCGCTPIARGSARHEKWPALCVRSGVPVADRLAEVNYHTLADFRVEKQQELEELFTQVWAALSKEGLITLEQIAVRRPSKRGPVVMSDNVKK